MTGYCVVPWETAFRVPRGVAIVDAAGIREQIISPYTIFTGISLNCSFQLKPI